MTDDEPDDLDLQRNLAVGLRRWRHRKGISQETAAKVLGMHRTYYSRIEQVRQNLTLKSVERLAEKLDVDPIDLLRGLPSWATE